MAVSCKDDGFPVPPASTQADLSYVAVKEADTTAPFGFRFKVEFANKSLNATSYLWDFGNGETSNQENPTVFYYQSGQYNISLTVGTNQTLHYNKLRKAVTITAILDAVPLPFAENFNGSDDIPIFSQFWMRMAMDGAGIGVRGPAMVKLVHNPMTVAQEMRLLQTIT